jgi:hypothetical protein
MDYFGLIIGIVVFASIIAAAWIMLGIISTR